MDSVGVASIRSDENAAQDSFGLVALCSVGPILAVMVLALTQKATVQEVAESTDSSKVNILINFSDNALDKVMKVIEEELSDSEFSINDFCRMLGMSRTSVCSGHKLMCHQRNWHDLGGI